MLDSLTIKNFTAFEEASFQFVAGINVFVGGNASGKTHAMKLLYAVQKLQADNGSIWRDPISLLLSTFRPEGLKDLVRVNSESATADITVVWQGSVYSLMINETVPTSPSNGTTDQPETITIERGQSTAATAHWHVKWEGVSKPVFIPVKDMLAHSVGFLSLYDQRYVDFDDTHRDILLLAFLPTLRENGRKEINPLLDKLADKIGGRVEVKGERFYINGEKGRFEMHLVAEGWRKLALLYQLLANGSIARGTVLYWDEPEANLNPGVFPLVAEILASLATAGTQFHIATHSYALLREIEFASKREGCKLRMFSLDDTEHGVQVQQVERFVDLKPNPILDEYERIFGLSVQEALRGG